MNPRPKPDAAGRLRDRKGPEHKRMLETLAFCLGVVLIGVIVQTAGHLKGDSLVFPGVGEILEAFFRLIRTGRTWLFVWTTFRHLAVSMAVSTVISLVIGLAEGASDFVRALFRPLMVMLRSLPMIVLVVVVMVLIRYQHVPVVVTSLVLIPMISEAVCEGSRRIDPELKDVYRLHSSMNLSILWHVHLPLMAGYLRQAYINAAGMGLKLAVTGEYLVQTRDSLGKAVYSSAYFNEYAEIYAYALLMILLIVLVTELPLWLERLLGGDSQEPEA